MIELTLSSPNFKPRISEINYHKWKKNFLNLSSGHIYFSDGKQKLHLNDKI